MPTATQIKEVNQTGGLASMERCQPMATTSERSLIDLRALLGHKLLQRDRVNHEDSVDIEHPVRVDQKANPKWRRGHSCWEAKGKCAQDYKEVETKLLKELDQSRQESFCEVCVSLFMIGKTPQKAKPVIIISSEDKRSREEARKAITSSGILEDLGFEIGVLKYLPSGPIHPIAGSRSEESRDSATEHGRWNEDTRDTMKSGSTHHQVTPIPQPAYYNPSQRLRMTGMPVYAKTADERSRMGTANLICNGSRYGYITAAHIFSPPNQGSLSDDGEEDLGVPFDSDSDEEDDSGVKLSFAGGLISELKQAESSQILSHGGTRSQKLPRSGMASESSVVSSEFGLGLALLGHLTPEESTGISLDYALIALDDTELPQQLKSSRVFSRIRKARVSTARNMPSQATAWTSHGPVPGTLINVPTLMRLPGSRFFQPILTFAYHGKIEYGDSGSLVLDTASKELYGMIIAASDHQPVAYIVSAERLCKHIAGIGWHVLSADDTYMESGEWDDQAAYALTAQGPQASLPAIDVLQVNSVSNEVAQADSSSKDMSETDSSPNNMDRADVSSKDTFQANSLLGNISQARTSSTSIHEASVSSNFSRWTHGMLDPSKPQPEWNTQFQRYLYLQFNDHYQGWYWNHHDGQSWVFFDWVPSDIAPPQPQMPPRIQSQSDVYQVYPHSSHPRFDSATVPSANIREGKAVFGSYDQRNALPDSHYEQLDPSFYVRDSAFFIEGRVFSVLFSEAAGANAVNALEKINSVTDYNSSISMIKYRELLHTQLRRFIVVRHRKEFCFAVPIFTYQGQGTKKPGVSPNEHAIAYSHGGYGPQLLPEEAPLTKHPICIVMNNGERPLATASRIYFGIHHPIHYNVKVKDIGVVHQDWLPTFIGYWNMENISDTRQSNEVTNEAAQDDYF